MNIWEVTIVTVLSYVALVAPVQVAILPAPQEVDALLMINCFVDLIFACDMALQFFTMYQRKTKVGFRWEHRLRKISCHYLQSWFFIDLVSIIPFDLISFLEESQTMKQAKAVKLVRLFRLLKLLRLCRSTRFFRFIELHMSVTYGNLALGKYFCLLLVIAHWLANLWALTLLMVDPGTEDRWIDSFTEREVELNVVDLTEKTPWKLYLTSLYFTIYTITSVGYGDIGPKNKLETCVAIFMVIISGISWAILLGQVCGVVAGIGEEESEFRLTMDGLNAMMADHVLPSQMQFRLRSFFLNSKLAQRRVYRQQKLITFMSPGLQGEVVLTLNKKWMEKVNMVKPIMMLARDTDVTQLRRITDAKAFLVDLSMKLEPLIFSQEEAIGHPHTLYILQRGIIGGRGRMFNSGTVWGEDFLLLDESLAFPYEATTLTYVELKSLSRASFLEVMERYRTKLPELQSLIRYHCRWLAVQRGIRREVWKRLGSHGQPKVPLKP
jgi:potassium voltage-gated channel Eag-related subfamily H protein 7